MKIFAIEASGPVAGCALLDGEKLVADYSVQYKMKHSQTLVPMMEEVKEMVELDLSTIDAIAITEGPGSFTGLRIGAATAKAMGLALKKPIIGVPTVDAIAYNLYGTSDLICPIMDARRSQVYTGIYESTDEELVTLRQQCVVPLEEIVQELNERGRGVIFLGDGVPVYREKIASLMEVPFHFAPAHLSRQRAAATAALALQRWEKLGDAVLTDADAFRPEYLRLSQAEREHGERRNYSLVGEQK